MQQRWLLKKLSLRFWTSLTKSSLLLHLSLLCVKYLTKSSLLLHLSLLCVKHPNPATALHLPAYPVKPLHLRGQVTPALSAARRATPNANSPCAERRNCNEAFSPESTSASLRCSPQASALWGNLFVYASKNEQLKDCVSYCDCWKKWVPQITCITFFISSVA